MNISYHLRERKSKKGGYQIVVELPSNHKNGKRNRIYKTVHGSKKMAQQVALKLIQQLETQTYVAPSKISVAEYMDLWLEMYNADKSPTTLSGYRYQVDNYIKPLLGDILIQELSTAQVQQWVNGIFKKSPLSEKSLSAKTVRNIFLNLSAAMSRAISLDLVSKNPCDNVILPKVKKYKVHVYDEEGVKKLLECAKGTDMELPVILGVTLGLRRGELIALRWENVDLVKGIVTICENMVKGQDGKVITKSPKSMSGNRQIPLSSSLLTLMKEYYRRYLEIKLKYRVGNNKDDYVICQPDGKPYKPISITQKFGKLLKDNNLEHIRLHDLRHINATLMLTHGISPKVAQQRLGHSDFSTTMNVYSHVLASVENEAAEKLDSVLFQNVSNQ